MWTSMDVPTIRNDDVSPNCSCARHLHVSTVQRFQGCSMCDACGDIFRGSISKSWLSSLKDEKTARLHHGGWMCAVREGGRTARGMLF